MVSSTFFLSKLNQDLACNPGLVCVSTYRLDAEGLVDDLKEIGDKATDCISPLD